MGIPPLTGLLPSSLAAELSQRFSLPLLFQLVTVAPYSNTSTESPVGNEATTRPDSVWTDGCGPATDGDRAEGLLGRSIMGFCEDSVKVGSRQREGCWAESVQIFYGLSIIEANRIRSRDAR